VVQSAALCFRFVRRLRAQSQHPSLLLPAGGAGFRQEEEGAALWAESKRLPFGVRLASFSGWLGGWVASDLAPPRWPSRELLMQAASRGQSTWPALWCVLAAARLLLPVALGQCCRCTVKALRGWPLLEDGGRRKAGFGGRPPPGVRARG